MNDIEPSNTPRISVSKFKESEDKNILKTDKSVQYSKENSADNNIQQSASFNLSSLAFFIRPPCNEIVEVKLAILKNHPIQPSVLINDKLSFDPNKIYYQNIQTTK
ncbi:zinc finger MYM-type protein 1-like [Aphis craccivora]|uniref:Zinc finger MYM-type protein 1-like n=1 Tax=Aphis craccivora TaxID=307492 RepID=A0A6G0VU83_APHCR|nr:zinc finger MYM-type protein 1-like [Aphis craccivora]